jgi:thiamine pyrophosphokinase
VSTTNTSNTTSNRVVLDYTSRDYKAIRSTLVGLAKGLVPEWENVGNTGDFGTLLLELYAYAGDVMHYYIDRVASEAFLGTAVRRQSLMYIADMFGYRPGGQAAALVPVTFTWNWDTDDYNGGFPGGEFTIQSATLIDGVATLTLNAAGNQRTSLTVGQTVIVENTGENSPYDGNFIVETVVTNTAYSNFTITYSVISTNPAPDPIATTAKASTGSIIIIPAKTVLTSSSKIKFELNYNVILDSHYGVTLEGTTTKKTLSKTGVATEGTTEAPTLIGISKGIPNSDFLIPDPGIVDSTVTVFTKEGNNAIPWSRVGKLSYATPTQSVYTTYIDDENYTHIVFGDNSSGRTPPTGCEIWVGYRYGIGFNANNVGVDTITTLNNSFATQLGVTVTNTASPTGGRDTETVEQMRYSIPRATTLKQRAITIDDYINLALQVPGVTKAIAYGSNYSTVYIVVASSANSNSYVTSSVKSKYVTGNIATLIIDKSLGLNLDQTVYVESAGTTALNGSFSITETFYDTVPITVVAKAYDNYTDVATLTTSASHQFSAGQPVTVSGIGTPFDGSYVLSSVTGTTLSYRKPIGTGTTGTSSASSVNNKVRAGYAATLTTAAAHGFSVGQMVTVSSVGSPFDGTFKITAVTPTTFTYNTVSTGTVASAAVSPVGSATIPGVPITTVSATTALVQGAPGFSYEIDNVTNPVTTSATISNKALTDNVATLTTSAGHSFSTGQSVTIAGVPTDTFFNGTYTITSTPTATTFTYALTHADVVSASATGTASVSGLVTTDVYTEAPVSNKALTSNVATLTTSSTHGFSEGQTVIVTGVDSTFNGTYTIIDVPTTTTFTYGKPGSPNVTSIAVSPVGTARATDSMVTTTDNEMQRLISSVESYMSDKKLIGSVVYGEPVQWFDIDASVLVQVLPLYNKESVRASVQSAIENVFSYENVDFGKRVSIGDVYRAALSVDGVDYVTINTLREVGNTDTVTVQDLETPDYKLPRISPDIKTSLYPAGWVTAKGGLVNT